MRGRFLSSPFPPTLPREQNPLPLSHVVVSSPSTSKVYLPSPPSQHTSRSSWPQGGTSLQEERPLLTVSPPVKRRGGWVSNDNETKQDKKGYLEY